MTWLPPEAEAFNWRFRAWREPKALSVAELDKALAAATGEIVRGPGADNLYVYDPGDADERWDDGE